MNPATYIEWVELQHFLKEHYPDLPLPGAHIKFFHDVSVKLPRICAEVIAPILPQLGQQSPEIVESINILCGSSLTTFFFRMAGITRDAIAKSTDANTGAGSSATAPIAANAEPLSADVIAAAGFVARTMEELDKSADRVIKHVHGIDVIGKSLFDRINYYGSWMQTVSAIQLTQGSQAIQALSKIGDHLEESNIITASGSGGPDGFARHVYDFIKERTDKIDDGDGDKHSFFLYNPGTEWHGPFHRLMDKILYHQRFSIRAQCEQELTFHLLVLSYHRISIKEQLHFPDCLQPFQVEGTKHKGNPLVEFNRPAAPAGLLHGVANVLDPKGSNAIAHGVTIATAGPIVGWGVNGFCLALGVGLGSITGLGAVVAIPAWFGTAI